MFFSFRSTPLALACMLAAFSSAGCSEEPSSFMQKSGSGGATTQSFFVPEVDDLVEDEDTGLRIIKDVLNITFSAETDEAKVNDIIASMNGKIVGYDKAVNFYQVRFNAPDLAELDRIRLKLLSEFKEVETASTAPISVHKNPYYIK